MKKIITITGAVLLAFAAIAASTSEQSEPKKQLVSVEYDGPVAAAVGAPAHDYKLERESCCGPQQ